MQLKKNNVYIIRIKKNAREIATELGIMSEVDEYENDVYDWKILNNKEERRMKNEN